MDVTSKVLRTVMNTGYFTIALTLWLISCSCHRSTAIPMCSSSDYFNMSSNECTTCTKCEDTGLQYFTNCTLTSDSICYRTCIEGQFFDRSSGLCTNCSNCTKIQSKCTPISDTVCNICTDNSKIYDTNLHLCVTDCSNTTPCVCSTGEYYNNDTKSCTPCMKCSDDQFVLTECSANHDEVCQDSCPLDQFFDGNTKSCRNCTQCKSLKNKCSGARDTECCLDKEFFHPIRRVCTPRCSECRITGECDTDFNCKCTACFKGRFCDIPNPECVTSPPPTITYPPTARSTEGTTSSMNPVTSALIALGSVVGIILFSALFVLLGVITSCNKGQTQNYSSSNNSTDNFLEETKATSALISMYKQNSISLGECRSSTDLMKLTGSGRSLNSSSSSTGSPRGSPRFPAGTPRSSPAKHKDSFHHTSNYNFKSPIAVPV